MMFKHIKHDLYYGCEVSLEVELPLYLKLSFTDIYVLTGYHLKADQVSWAVANTTCANLGMSLVSITSQVESNVVTYLLQTGNGLVIIK